MIREFHNPMALPPESIRKDYLKLIELLGSKKYGERAAALKILEKDKTKLRGLFKSQLGKVGVEAKSRLWKLLPEKDRPQDIKKSNVKKKQDGEAEELDPMPE